MTNSGDCIAENFAKKLKFERKIKIMYEIINWIIFGLFTTALIADSAYTLSCLLKIETNFLLMLLVLFFFANILGLLAFTSVLTHVKPYQLGLNSLTATFAVDLVILLMIILFNHGCPISDYKWQQKQAKDIFKQKTIKI